MTGSAFWRPIWEAKYGTPAVMSGRSTYTEDQRHLLADEAARLLDLQPQDSLLDVGCAAGFTGEFLISRVQRYAGADYNDVALAAWAKRCPWGMDLYHCSATDLSIFRDREFSKSLMGSVLLCLSKDECRLALTELRRVTRERALVSGNLEGKAPTEVQCPPGCRCHAHATWFERGELEALALECGWSRAEAVDIHSGLREHKIMFDLVCYA